MGSLEDGVRQDGVRQDGVLADGALADGALDGNAIGGLLLEVFGTEMTTAVGRCGSCGTASRVAELAVYEAKLGVVVRCRACGSVLMVFVQVRGIHCADLWGLASLG
jgi:Family of unknown function (DUF6510)